MKTHHRVLTNPNTACRLLTVFSLTGWPSPMQGPSGSCTIWSLAPFKLPLMSLVLSCLLQSHWPPFDSLKHHVLLHQGASSHFSRQGSDLKLGWLSCLQWDPLQSLQETTSPRLHPSSWGCFLRHLSQLLVSPPPPTQSLGTIIVVWLWNGPQELSVKGWVLRDGTWLEEAGQ